MNVVDSSGWLEYFTGGANAPFFAGVIEKPAALLVPSITLYEVFKRVLREHSEATALTFTAQMHQGEVLVLDEGIALAAARLSLQHRLPMADSLIYATARSRAAVLWTQDEHFAGLPGVKYRAKP